MKLPQAQQYAQKFVEWLTPVCDRIAIAGSVRRGRLFCNDVDLVVVPKREPVLDLVGPTGQYRNLLWEFLVCYVRHEPAAEWIQGETNPEGLNFLIKTPKTQLDLFCATEKTWGSVLLCRTGSKEHNIWLASRARERSLQWHVNVGLTGHLGASEEEIYRALGLPFIDPEHREDAYLRTLRTPALA